MDPHTLPCKAGRPARTYIQQLCEDTGCCPGDLPRAMNDREEWRERIRDIRATSARWWWYMLSRIRTLKNVHRGWKVSFSLNVFCGLTRYNKVSGLEFPQLTKETCRITSEITQCKIHEFYQSKGTLSTYWGR